MKIKVKSSSRNGADIGGVAVSYSRFPAIGRPKFADTLKFPDDVTELTSANISDLMGKYTKLWSYVNQECARLKVRLMRLQQGEAGQVNAIFRQTPGLLHTEKWKRDALVSENPKMEEIRSLIVSTQAELEYSQMYLANYDRYINALSRELTRKMHDDQLGTSPRFRGLDSR